MNEKPKVLRELLPEALTKKLDELRRESVRLKMLDATEQLKNKSLILRVRRQIARVLTVLMEVRKR